MSDKEMTPETLFSSSTTTNRCTCKHNQQTLMIYTKPLPIMLLCSSLNSRIEAQPRWVIVLFLKTKCPLTNLGLDNLFHDSEQRIGLFALVHPLEPLVAMFIGLLQCHVQVAVGFLRSKVLMKGKNWGTCLIEHYHFVQKIGKIDSLLTMTSNLA